MFVIPDLSPTYWILAIAITLIAAFTKGVTGFALPIIMVSGMASFLSPELAIASMVIPTFLSNAWQALRQGVRKMWEAFRAHWLLIVTTLVMIFVFAQILGRLELRALLILLGFAIGSISFVQLIGVRFEIREAHREIGAVIAGVIAGFFGSISGTWGPPTVIYLLAIGTEKSEQVRAQGISFGLGALVFWIAHEQSGLITPEALGLSALLVIPMFIGLYAGAKMQDRIDQEMFRKATLWVLLLAALNVLRRAYMG